VKPRPIVKWPDEISEPLCDVPLRIASDRECSAMLPGYDDIHPL
jgi:hypothetical protein